MKEQERGRMPIPFINVTISLSNQMANYTIEYRYPLDTHGI